MPSRGIRLAGLTALAALAGALGCASSEKISDPIDASSESSVGDGGVDASDANDAASDAVSDAAKDAAETACQCGDAGCGSCPIVAIVAAGGYGIDATEVTRGAYAEWLTTGPKVDLQSAECVWNTTFLPADSWPPDTGEMNFPVVGVDHCDASAYCRWAKKRLCGRIGGGPNLYSDFADATQSQWQNACSGGGTRLYPYGSSYSANACNGADYGSALAIEAGKATGCEGGYPGLFDMSGNVWEWEDSCDAEGGADDDCRIRGGSYAQAANALGCSADSSLPRSSSGAGVGFRCCE